MKIVNGGLRIGRTWLGLRRWHGYPKRIAWRSGGKWTPGPWWELIIPHIGTLVINRDRTIFGWNDAT